MANVILQRVRRRRAMRLALSGFQTWLGFAFLVAAFVLAVLTPVAWLRPLLFFAGIFVATVLLTWPTNRRLRDLS